MLPEKLQQKLNNRIKDNTLRKLSTQERSIDFSSNDYLGLSKSKSIFNQAHTYLLDNKNLQNGATGSRLLSGNHNLYEKVEAVLCNFHKSEAALIFNSGYDANIGFFSSVPQRNDIILYDELIHASIRDGINMSNAKAFKFKHNNLTDLKHQLERNQEAPRETALYVVSESVFSMDGDSPDLIKLSKLCKKYGAYLIIDEAHAIGVFGAHGFGKIQELKLEETVFARIITFGKALGCHGAAVLGNIHLKQYLINFARSFIYTTGLPPHTLATIHCAYKELYNQDILAIKKLHDNIVFFKSEITRLSLEAHFIESDSAIHCCIIPGNKTLKKVAGTLQKHSFDVKAILSPTVVKGQERLRFCLHSYNTSKEITSVLELLSKLL